MTPRKGRHKPRRTVIILYVEGDTEKEFFTKIKTAKFPTKATVIVNLKGGGNFYRKLFGHLENYLTVNTHVSARVVCCYDREGRIGLPPISQKSIREGVKGIHHISSQVLSIDFIIATQMIESWLFYDIEGIFKYLSLSERKHNKKNYLPPEKCNCNDMNRLFKVAQKTYFKGRKSAGFIDSLDIERIYLNCEELKGKIDKISGY